MKLFTGRSSDSFSGRKNSKCAHTFFRSFYFSFRNMKFTKSKGHNQIMDQRKLYVPKTA